MEDFGPRGIGRVIDDAIAAYRAGFRTLAVPAACLLLPTGLFLGLAQSFYLQTVSRSASLAGTDVFAYVSALSGPYGILAGVTSLRSVIALYYFACVLAAAPEIIARRHVRLGAFLGAGLRRLPAVLLTGVAVGLLTSLGTLALIVPGIMLGVYLSMAEPVSGVENVWLDRSLTRSFGLVRGHFWRTVGFFAATFVIVSSIESAITSVVTVQAFVQQFTGGMQGGLPSLGWQLFAGVLTGVAQALTLPLMYVAWLYYYLDLRARREGMDLLSRAYALVPRA